MSSVIGTSKITSRGQVTIPVEARKSAGFAPGERVTFIEEEDGSIRMVDARTASLRAFDELRRAFEGAADEAGLSSEADVVDMIDRFRRGEAI